MLLLLLLLRYMAFKTWSRNLPWEKKAAGGELWCQKTGCPGPFFFSFHPGHNSSFFSFLTRSFFLFFLTRPYFFFLVFVFLPVSSVSLLNIILTISVFSLLCQVFTSFLENESHKSLQIPFFSRFVASFFCKQYVCNTSLGNLHPRHHMP